MIACYLRPLSRASRLRQARVAGIVELFQKQLNFRIVSFFRKQMDFVIRVGNLKTLS